MRQDKPKVDYDGRSGRIGPEITVKALSQAEIAEACRPIVIGDQQVLKKALDSFGAGMGLKVLRNMEGDPMDPHLINVLDTGNVDVDKVQVGQASAAGGRAVFEDIKRAVLLAEGKKIDGIVAGPHNKYSVNLAGVHFAGYPPLLAKLTGSRYAFNMLVAGPIRIVGATLHMALKDVSRSLTADLVRATIEAADAAVKRLGVVQPRIAVAGLNPHCGEEGLFGEEDDEVIRPAIDGARQSGVQAFGPLPADSLFVGIKDKQEYDAYVAMYHDQSHIPDQDGCL